MALALGLIIYLLRLVHFSIPALILASMVVTLILFWVLNLKYAMGAIVALVHDVTITVGLFSIFGKEFTLPIIAAMLTIIGYSLNDTIIVFDRIRENLAKYRKEPLSEIINKSVNETLSRTFLTSGTTLIVVLALFILGGGIIHDFAFAMLVGIIVGTYSSVFVASPILLAWQKTQMRHHSMVSADFKSRGGGARSGSNTSKANARKTGVSRWIVISKGNEPQMNDRLTNAIPWLTLQKVPGVGNLLFRRLIKQFGSPDKVLGSTVGELVGVKGITADLARKILKQPKSDGAVEEISSIFRAGYSLLTQTDPQYPPLLLQIPDPPPIIYYFGQPPNYNNTIAVVGARKSTAYGRKVTWELSRLWRSAI